MREIVSRIRDIRKAFGEKQNQLIIRLSYATGHSVEGFCRVGFRYRAVVKKKISEFNGE